MYRSCGQLIDPFMGRPTVTFHPTVSMSLDVGRFGAALNLSYLLTKDTSEGDLDLGDEIQLRAGLWGVAVPDLLDLIAEVGLSTPVDAPFEGPVFTSAELPLGVRAVN